MPEDARFLASLGLNCIRIPINYRHFIRDDDPTVIRQEGFRLIDRIVDMCAAEGLYTIIDMHTFPGGQNQVCSPTSHPPLYCVLRLTP